MKPAGTRSGASVTSVTPRRGAVSRCEVFRSGRADHRADRARRRSPATGTAPRDECRERRASTPTRPSTASQRRRASSPALSLISVGSSAVVPKRRCAATIAANALRRRRVVEQHVAAAIDLDVDEARRQPRVRRQIACTGIRGGSSRARTTADDRVAVDHHGAVAAQRRAVEDACRRRPRASRRSSRARDLLQMARPVGVDAARVRRKPDQHRVEALDQADGVGFGRDRARAPAAVACAVRTRREQRRALSVRRVGAPGRQSPSPAASAGMNIRIG